MLLSNPPGEFSSFWLPYLALMHKLNFVFLGAWGTEIEDEHRVLYRDYDYSMASTTAILYMIHVLSAYQRC